MTDEIASFGREPSSKIAVFPLARRAAKLRRVAEVLVSRDRQAASTYWKQTVTTMARQLERAGVPPETIEGELHQFRDAVEIELRMRRVVRRRPDGDAA
jgi:hypothetical protein